MKFKKKKKKKYKTKKKKKKIQKKNEKNITFFLRSSIFASDNFMANIQESSYYWY